MLRTRSARSVTFLLGPLGGLWVLMACEERRRPLGDECLRNDDCLSTICVSRVCVALGPVLDTPVPPSSDQGEPPQNPSVDASRVPRTDTGG
jgi:hypothetical protein